MEKRPAFGSTIDASKKLVQVRLPTLCLIKIVKIFCLSAPSHPPGSAA